MKKYILQFLVGVLILSNNLSAQQIDKIINPFEVERIEQILSADSMEGRKVFTPGIDKAANFIASEFRKNGLQYYQQLHSYRQDFNMIRAKFISAKGTFDGQPLDPKNIIAFTSQADLIINNNSGYEKKTIAADSNFITTARAYMESDKNYLLIVDPSNASSFCRVSRLKRESF